MKYRLAYEKHFAESRQRNAEYKGKLYSGISIYFECRMFKDGEEVFFTCRDDEEPVEYMVDGYYLPAFFNVGYDKENGYKLTLTELAHKSEYCIAFIPIYAFTWENCATPREISVEESVEVLKALPNIFDHSDSIVTQSASYGVVAV